MNTVLKYTAALTVAGALAVAMSTPSDARSGRRAAAAVGFGAGMMVGAAAASGAYYGPGGYAYGPGYYGPGYGAYAYSPQPWDSGNMSCVTQGTYGKQLDYAGCY